MVPILIASFLMLPLVAFGEVDSAIGTTVCEIARAPMAFHGKVVSVRAPIQIGFENFGLSVSECADKKLDFIWLEYGTGPKRQPTTWCCGDMVPRDSLVLVQDAQFRRFHRLLTAERKSKGCYGCYLRQVTATITGRFDAVETRPCPGDGKSLCCGPSGFGHLGMACGRIVIRSVSDVVASRAGPTGEKK
jgi:hypothetical protein